MKNLLKFTLSLFVLSLLFTACTKEDSDLIEEKKEVIENPELVLRVTIDGETSITDAYAAYCEVDGKQAVQVSNKEVLLGDEINVENFAAGDFLVYHFVNGEDSGSIGGATFEDNDNGLPILSVILDAQAEVVIDSADEELVTGSMTGTFNLANGSTADYSVEFVAPVVQTSNLCD